MCLFILFSLGDCDAVRIAGIIQIRLSIQASFAPTGGKLPQATIWFHLDRRVIRVDRVPTLNAALTKPLSPIFRIGNLAIAQFLAAFRRPGSVHPVLKYFSARQRSEAGTPP
jgi:hypothetical protein